MIDVNFERSFTQYFDFVMKIDTLLVLKFNSFEFDMKNKLLIYCSLTFPTTLPKTLA